MFDTAIIEIVIGLVLVFSLVAILVTQINSLITMFFNLRARELKAGIAEMITDPEMRAKILAHPIIGMVQTTVSERAQLTETEAENIADIEETKTNYVAPQTFVEALISILITQSDSDLFMPLQKAVRYLDNSVEKSQLRELVRQVRANFSEENIRQIYDIAARLADEKERQHLIDALQEVEGSIERLYFKSNEMLPLMDGIYRISDRSFQTALEAIIKTAETFDEARKRLETWYDDHMQRVSESFSRRMGRISLGVALVITVIFNVDALFIASTLWQDDELRAAVVLAAENFEPEAATPENTESAESAEEATDSEDPAVTLDEIDEQIEEVDDTIQALLNLQLPIGWNFTEITDEMIGQARLSGLSDPTDNTRNLWNYLPGNSDGWYWLWLQKFLGIVATTIAAAQGAPFWFDLLNRLSSRRD